MTVRIGIGGWTYAPWRGDFYPAGLAQSKEQAFAAASFGAIEINSTFYSRQSPASWAKWAVARHLWVALSHEINYRRPTFLDDIVVADVIAEKVEGAKALFTTVIKRGETVLAEVKSSWCCLDAVSKRPARLARDIAARFLVQD